MNEKDTYRGIDNRDLKERNLYPEELPRQGGVSKYIDIFLKIRRMPPGTAFYVDSKIKPNAIATELRYYRARYGVPFKTTITEGKVYVYKDPEPAEEKGPQTP